MNRSAGVTAIAVLALIGSALALGIAVLALVGLVAVAGQPAPKDFPASPALFRAIILLVPLFYALVAAWGIASGVGLLQLKNWARISTIVFSILLIMFGAFGALGSLAVSLAPASGGVDQQSVVFARAFMVLFAVGQIGVGVWWLVFFNRPRVKEQFVARPMVAGFPPMQAAYPIQPSYHVQPPPAAVVAVAPSARQRPLSISIIAWIMLASCVFVPINVVLHAPAFLFTRVLAGWQATVFFAVVAGLMIYVGVGLLYLKPLARVVGIAHFAFAFLSSTVFYFAPGGYARMMKLLEAQQSLFPWMREWQAMSPQINMMPYLISGVVIGLALTLVPLYFLIKEKRAFEKAHGAHSLSLPASSLTA